MSDLLQKQFYFSEALAKFILQLRSNGYQVTVGECYRPPETAEIYRAQGKGIGGSLHTLRLAVDLCLFENGVYLKELWQYRRAGDIWKTYSTDLCRMAWGGDFASQDANHFSIEHEGRK